jgi:CHAT domain
MQDVSIYAGRLATKANLPRNETVYRVRELNSKGLVEIEHLTDYRYCLSMEVTSVVGDIKTSPDIWKRFANQMPQTIINTKGEDEVSILFLAADPTNATRLRLGEEFREIQEKLQLAKLRQKFSLEQRTSVRPTDLSQAMLDLQPNIVHFSGHGTSSGELCFENVLGVTQLVTPDALAALFEQFANHVTCVVLNACYSITQTNAISQHISYVIGMDKAVGDRAAIAFAVGFYQAIGAGKTVEEAYKLGTVQIRLQGILEHSIPKLITQ